MIQMRRALSQFAIVLILAVGGSIACAQSTTDVWLDVDTAIGIPSGEVDDGLAMIQAFHSPELNVRGLSVTFGNTSLERAVPIASEVAAKFGPPGLVAHVGASGAVDLGNETDAVTAMADALREKPMTILALGPVTSVATLVRDHPDLAGRIDAIVMVAARRPGQRFQTGASTNRPHRDFNFELDPEAMQVLLDSDVKLVFAPWEVSSHVWMRRDDLQALKAKSGSGAWVEKKTRSWIQRWEDNLGVDGFNPFDTLGVGWVTHPELMESFEGGAWIEQARDDTLPEGSSSTRAKPYLLVDPARADLKQVTYLFKPKAEFKSVLIERLAGAEN